MKFNEFCTVVFELLEREPVDVTEYTSLKNDLDVDSLQMVNFTTSMADRLGIPFEIFINNADRIDTIGGLYKTVLEGVAQ